MSFHVQNTVMLSQFEMKCIVNLKVFLQLHNPLFDMNES